MSKTYKGYELIKAISEGDIKEDTKFREMEENRYYIVKDIKLWEQGNTGIYSSKLENLQIIYGVFELMEDEIDIQSMKEVTVEDLTNSDGMGFLREIDKLNEIIRAIKQLDNKIKEK